MSESSATLPSSSEIPDTSVSISSEEQGHAWTASQLKTIASVLGEEELPFFDLGLSFEVRAVDGALSIVSYETMLMSEMTTVAGELLVDDGYEYITGWYPNTPYGMRILQKKTDTQRIEVRIFAAEDRPAEGEVDPTAFTRGMGYFWLYLTSEERSPIYPEGEIKGEVRESLGINSYCPPEPEAPEGIGIYDYRTASSSSSLFQNASSLYVMVETDDIRGLGIAYGKQLEELGYHKITAIGGSYLAPDGIAFLTLVDFEGEYMAIVVDPGNGYSITFPTQISIGTAYRGLFGEVLKVDVPKIPDDVEIGCYAPIAYRENGDGSLQLCIYCFVEAGDAMASYGNALATEGWLKQGDASYLSSDGKVKIDLESGTYFMILLSPAD